MSYGFEIYYLFDNKYSILDGTNRAKTIEEITKTECSMNILQEKLASIVTRDGLPSRIAIKNMDRYNLPNMNSDNLDMIINYCKSLGQRPTEYSSNCDQYKTYNMETGQFYVPNTNTELYIQIENIVTPSNPFSSFDRLVSAVYN
jgi:hypothetical protein